MYQLNTELLEQLSVTFEYLKNSGVCLPDKEKFESLVNKAIALLEEIQADEPKILQYNASKRKVTDFFRNDETNGEVTEPE
jgi:hypothetical protein